MEEVKEVGGLLRRFQCLENNSCPYTLSRAVYMNPGTWEGALLRVNFNWLRIQVLGIPHLHGKAFQEIEPGALWRVMGHRSGREEEALLRKGSAPLCTSPGKLSRHGRLRP